jgi:hypothetical protein
MKKLCLSFLPAFLFCHLVTAQNELQFELEERLSELIEQHEEKKLTLLEMEGELEEVNSEDDDFGQALLETEIEGMSDWIRQNTGSLEGLSQIIESKDFEEEEKESILDAAIGRHHRRNQLLELELQSRRLEVELQLHEEEGEEEDVDRLESRLDRLNERIEKTKGIHANWDLVEAARKAGEHDRAEELGHALWVQERELDLMVELEGRQLEVAENQRHAEGLKKETERVEEILALSSEMQKQTEMRVSKWTELKKRLNKSEGEARHELIEEYHLSEEKFHLRNEILNVRRQLVFAESEGGEEEVDELNEFIEELKQEIQEIEE